ncbi:MAG: lamin tail domain-containing protein, partial [Anaerolineae bacterium]
EEWVEVFNASTAAVDLSGWQLRDNTSASPLSAALAPGQVAVISAGSAGVVLTCPALSATVARACLGNGLADDGDTIALEDASGRAIDAMTYGGPGTAVAPLTPPGRTLVRFREADSSFAAWSASDPGPGCLQGRPATVPTPTDSATPTAPQDQSQHPVYLPIAWQREGLTRPPTLLISEVLYDGVADEGEEFVELRNYTGAPLSLAGMYVGDAERPGDGEAMYAFPSSAAVPARGTVTIARCAAAFYAHFHSAPDLEFRAGACADTPGVPDLARAAGWGSSPFGLADDGDEVLLLSAQSDVLDSVAYGNGDFVAAGLQGDARAAQPLSLQRVAGLDADDMSLDFAREAPSPGTGLDLPAPSAPAPSPAWRGLYCFWGNLHAHTSSSDGAGPAELALARARAAGLHFYAITDHDHSLRSAEWRRTRAAAADATVAGAFVGLAGIEWTSGTEGHVNVIGGYEMVSRDDADTADLAGLYRWLNLRPSLVAQFNHPGRGAYFGGQSAAGDPPAVGLQEVGNSGSGSAPNLYEDELLLSWRHGWRVAPTIGADTHTTAWGTDLIARTGAWASGLDAAAIMAALDAGRVFASEDADLALGWRCGDTWMGGELPAAGADSCSVYYHDGEGEDAIVRALDFDGNVLVEWSLASGAEQEFAWPTGAAAMWLKGSQRDGDVVWAAPLWHG